MRPRQPDAVGSAAPVSGVRERDSDSAEKISSPAEPSDRRRARSSRPPVRVDDVGDVAVAIAARAHVTSAPKLLKARNELTSAPIDHRDAFVISLIDGRMSVGAIVDVSGMSTPEIVAILERLARLGIVSLP
jgi:hypothetical protein